ncbi:hypothetical protein [Limnoglobus roseus]|uniref:Uncharacterized protein n=1 Tax=Limnoglobus roseus TaxID=2598579 RepID=A0A5C1AHQ9_9BACT|nr:hypothetical protein [Limnoglobus roseus]QEL17536.1 hypothetical protein PX52LOC_04526 [Limnoglobus roseus]
MPDHVISGMSGYPGVAGFDAVNYSIYHGSKPGEITASTPFPIDAAPPFGDFLMSDGERSLLIRDCKVVHSQVEKDGGGFRFTLTLLDRAWRWQTGAISGHYNRRDERGNIVGPTAKTPKELAELCLKEMGEKGYKVYFPEGLKASQIKTDGTPVPGQSSPPTNTNPEVIWEDKLPVDAVCELCDLFGLRFMRCPVRDIVVIARAGDGEDLPDNEFRDTVTLGLDATATPPGLGVVGDAVKYQMRLKLIPMAKEWHTGYVEADKVSYRPNRQPQRGKWTIKFSGSPAGTPFTSNVSVNGVDFPTSTHSSINSAAAQVVGVVNGTPAFDNVLEATVIGSGDTVQIQAVEDGVAVPISATLTSANPAAGAGAVVTTVDLPISSPWDFETPGQWYGVRPTDRLSYDQARQMAVESIGRCFRVADDDVSSGWSTKKSTHVSGRALTIDSTLFDNALTYSVSVNGGLFNAVGQGSAGGTLADLAAQINAALSTQMTASYDAGAGTLRITPLNGGPVPDVVILSGEVAGGAAVANVTDGTGPASKSKKIFVPYYGEVDWRKNLLLLPDKVEQVVPEKPDTTRATTLGLVADQENYYDGWSRNQQASVYGSISNLCIGRWHAADHAENSPAGSLVAAPSVLDAGSQMVVFTAGPVYRRTEISGLVYTKFPNLALETAVNVLDNKTFAPVTYKRWMDFGKPPAGSDDRDRNVEIDLSKYGVPKSKPFAAKLPKIRENVGTDDVPKKGTEWHGHRDMQLGVIARYQYDAKADAHVLSEVLIDPQDVSKKVGDYYLIGHLLEHQVTGGYSVGYHGIQLIPMDGAVMHLTWSTGRGARTQASRNMEHSTFLLPYPARRRTENQEANATRTILNLTSKAEDWEDANALAKLKVILPGARLIK